MTQLNKLYYYQCKARPEYYRTIQMYRNPMTGNINSRVSNIVYGTPPDGMEEIPELMRQRVMSCNNALPYNF